MIKELEEVVDVPAAHICTVVPISQTVGANRIVPAVAIPYPLGNPDLGEKEEEALRRKLVLNALKALSTDVTEQTVFQDA